MIKALKIQLVVLAIGLFFTGAAHAATITVTSIGDAVAVDGSVSLREAITSINNGANLNADVVAVGAYGTSDTINFGIAGAGGHVISILTSLPPITKQITINGYSQGPGTPNSAVTGDNSAHNLVITGFSIASGDLLTLSNGSSGSIIRGVVFDGCMTGAAIAIKNSQNNVIAGNFIGTNNAGGFDAVAPNSIGASLTASGATDNISGNQIGGPNPPDRNVISGNTTREIQIVNSGGAGVITTGIVVQNNYLGTNAAGTAAISGSQQGIFMSEVQGVTIGGASGSLGGSCSGVCNLISGSANGVGIMVSGLTSSGNLIQGNFFGTDVTGTAVIPNGQLANIDVSATGSVTIGGTAAGTGNLISGEPIQGTGILFDGGGGGPYNVQGNYIGTTTTGNAVLANAGSGIHVVGATNVIIGGTTVAARNVIGGNGNGNTPKGPGILMEGNLPGSTATAVIQGNNIGIGADGNTNIGNIGDGIDFISSASGSTVGASTSGGLGGNIIAFMARVEPTAPALACKTALSKTKSSLTRSSVTLIPAVRLVLALT